MSSASSAGVKLEIGHVLFIDIVGYSKLLITEQREQMQKLREIVRATEQFRLAEPAGELPGVSPGGGRALGVCTTAEAPEFGGVEVTTGSKNHPELCVGRWI